MDLLSLLNGLVAQLADAQKAADDLAKAKFDEGFAAGVASVPPPSDKIFSQAELDAAVAAAVAPVQAQLDGVVAELAGLKEAFAAFKAAELEKVKALEVDFQ